MIIHSGCLSGRLETDATAPTAVQQGPVALGGGLECRRRSGGVGFSAAFRARGRGSHSSHHGRYQLRSPSSIIDAGRSTALTIVASIRIAAASPMPSCCSRMIEPVAKTAKTNTMTIAALVTTPAVVLMPCATASSVDSPRSGLRGSG